MPFSERYENVEEEETEEPQDDYSNENPGGEAFGYGVSQVTDPRFGTDNFSYAQWRATPSYLKDIQSAIVESNEITEIYKHALISVVYRLFNPSESNANNSIRDVRKISFTTPQDPLRIKMIHAERDLWLATCYATREDLLATNAQLMINNILEVYRAVLTQTTGEKRLGVISTEIVTRSISQVDRTTEQFDGQGIQKKKPGSFFSFFTGGK